MIRLDNCFVFKREKSKYYLTDVVNLSVWRKIDDSDKETYRTGSLRKRKEIIKETQKLNLIFTLKQNPVKKKN